MLEDVVGHTPTDPATHPQGGYPLCVPAAKACGARIF